MSTALEHDVSSLPMPTREEQFAIVAEASRAPSVHNVQPARWRFMPGAVLLLEDVRRRLPDADPSGHDTLVSLGAAWEGMRIALSLRGLELDTPDTLSVVDEHAPWMRVVARGAVSFAGDSFAGGPLTFLSRTFRSLSLGSTLRSA